MKRTERKISRPCIFFITDGELDLDDNSGSELDALFENGWFVNSERFVVIVGKDAINSNSDRNAVSKFVSNDLESMIMVNDMQHIVKIRHFLHVGSKSRKNNYLYSCPHEEYRNDAYGQNYFFA